MFPMVHDITPANGFSLDTPGRLVAVIARFSNQSRLVRFGRCGRLVQNEVENPSKKCFGWQGGFSFHRGRDTNTSETNLDIAKYVLQMVFHGPINFPQRSNKN
jgi:hypothetical protein